MSNIPLTDLRLGNIVQPTTFKSPKVVTGILPKLGIEVEDTFTVFEQFIEGIPITEEWLERFGFKLSEYRDSNWFHYDHALLNDFIYDLNNKCFRSYYEGLQTSKICNGVHDLQNCFYFLTGTELTLKQ